MGSDYFLLKRVMDVVVSGLLLLLLLPLGLLIGCAIRLETDGTPFFFQERVGRGCKPFWIVKFRSMVMDAAERGPYFTGENDARITRTGKFIRATSLDELPQLWNVLVGEMSLIGPRPDTPAQAASYSAKDWGLRHLVRPGITGLAQVNGRSAITPEDRLRFDLEYATQYNWKMDKEILLKTVSQVLRKVGVN